MFRLKSSRKFPCMTFSASQSLMPRLVDNTIALTTRKFSIRRHHGLVDAHRHVSGRLGDRLDLKGRDFQSLDPLAPRYVCFAEGQQGWR